MVSPPEVLFEIRVVRVTRGERFGEANGIVHFRLGFRLAAFPRKRESEICQTIGERFLDFRVVRAFPAQASSSLAVLKQKASANR